MNCYQMKLKLFVDVVLIIICQKNKISQQQKILGLKKTQEPKVDKHKDEMTIKYIRNIKDVDGVCLIIYPNISPHVLNHLYEVLIIIFNASLMVNVMKTV